jgi:hypothetical protein
MSSGTAMVIPAKTTQDSGGLGTLRSTMNL